MKRWLGLFSRLRARVLPRRIPPPTEPRQYRQPEPPRAGWLHSRARESDAYKRAVGPRRPPRW
jgi:hypothetical protein